MARDIPAGTVRQRLLRIPVSRTSRLYDWLRGSPSGIVALALGVGLGAGLGAIVFRELIAMFTLVFTGVRDYSATPWAAYPLLPAIGPFFLLAVPVLGGLLYGPLIDRFAREARGHGVPEVMFAVTEEGGRIRPRVAVVKSVASAICLGAGGSVGREGPIVQIGSALGSTMGQRLRLGEGNMRLLVACGAAGGISATFNAPIAGVFFALELILRDFEARSFGVVVLSSVMADIVGQGAFGSAVFLPLPDFQIVSLWEYPLYAILGLPAALVGVGFIRSLYGLEDAADRLWVGRPEWLRPVAGGVLLGALLLALPQLYGVGYPPIDKAETGSYAIGFLLLLVAGKMAATGLTIAIGGSGGVFAPSLYMGAMLGVAYGAIVGHIAPGIVGPAGAYGLVGMGAVFAAAARAPITSVLIMFELTDDYTIILPMMLAVALSAGFSALIEPDTIYTKKLRRRGVDVMRGRSANLMGLMNVAQAMGPVPEGVLRGASLQDTLVRFTTGESDALPVVDESGQYWGVLTMAEAEEAMRGNSASAEAGTLAQRLPPLKPSDSLEHALTLLVRHEASGLPVVASSEGHVVGWLTHRDLMRAYVSRLNAGPSSASGMSGTSGRAAEPARAGEPAGAGMPDRRERAARLMGYRLVDLAVGPGSPLAGCRIDEIAWPPLALPIVVRRGRNALQPELSTVLRAGDSIRVIVPEEAGEAYLDPIGPLRQVDAGVSRPSDSEPEQAEPRDSEPGQAEPEETSP
jgi:CIC family chloride channel protein